jgi:ferredoxin
MCPNGAAYVDTANGNVRRIDQAKCIGCGICLSACPQQPNRTIWDPTKKKATKCDLCLDTAAYWNEKGGPSGKQACVEICPMKALKMVTETPDQTETDGYNRNFRTANWITMYLVATNESYYLTGTAGTGGRISGASATGTAAAKGANVTITITPNTGYAISDVTVDGTSVGKVTTYTFTNVTANHKVTASFVATGTTTTTATTTTTPTTTTTTTTTPLPSTPTTTTPPPSTPTTSPSGVVITWDKAKDYMGKDVVVIVTGPAISTMDVFPPGITLFLGAEAGAGLDIYFVDPKLFNSSWINKTLTVTGKIIANSYGTPQLNVTAASQIVSVK